MYTIGEVAKIVGVKTSALRFWETEFDELSPHKTKFGHRSYTNKEIELIVTIKELLYNDGLTIKGAKARLNDKNKSLTNVESRCDFKSVKNKLNDLLKYVQKTRKELRAFDEK